MDYMDKQTRFKTNSPPAICLPPGGPGHLCGQTPATSFSPKIQNRIPYRRDFVCTVAAQGTLSLPALSVNKGVLMGAAFNSTSPPPYYTLMLAVSWQGTRIQARVLIDSGADDNFICPTLVHRLGVPTSRLATPLETNVLTGVALAAVDIITAAVHLLVSGNYIERIVFYMMKSPRVPLVLVRPWLQCQNPHIDWIKGIIMPGALLVISPVFSLPPVTSAKPLEEAPVDLSNVRTCTTISTKHPPRPWPAPYPPTAHTTAFINLYPGTIPPHGRLFSLSAPKRISDSWSDSPLVISCRSGFFLCEKEGQDPPPMHSLQGYERYSHKESLSHSPDLHQILLSPEL